MERHSLLWYDDGNIVLQADKTTFKVHRSILSRHSEFFSDMLHIGQEIDGEGTEAKPLIVPYVSGDTLAELLGVVYGPSGTPLPDDTKTLVGVLHAAHRLQFDNVLTIVARGLQTHSDLPALHKLKIATTCSPHLDSWLLPAFCSVVLEYKSVEDLPEDEMLDDTMRLRVVLARERISNLRLDFVFRLRGDIMTEHPSGGASLSPAERYAIIARVLPHTSRQDFFRKAFEMRTANSPHRTSIGKEMVDLSQSYLERWAPPHEYEVNIVTGIWQSFIRQPKSQN